MEAIGQIRIVFFRIVLVLLARDDDPLLKREDDEAMPLRVECCCCAANIYPSLSVFSIDSSYSCSLRSLLEQ